MRSGNLSRSDVRSGYAGFSVAIETDFFIENRMQWRGDRYVSGDSR